MQEFRSFLKPLLATVAILFATMAILYSALWTLYGNQQAPVELGFDNQYISAEHSELVQSVVSGSPAERAGMKPGDRIVRINGAPLEQDSLFLVWCQHKPGDSVELDILRPGVSVPLDLHATFRASQSASAEAGAAQHLGQGILRLYPFAFLTVGLAVLFLRLEDRNAWLLALMFGGFIAIPGFANSFLGVPSPLRPLAIAYRAIFDNMVASLFYFFFAVFPTRSPLDRRLPLLKWLALVLGVAFAFLGLGSSVPVWAATLGWLNQGYAHLLILFFNYAVIALGFLSLAWNAVSVDSSEARQKIRVILVGTLVGVVPATVALGAGDFFGFHIGLWLGVTLTVLLWLFPLSFAYAVVKHRVLEIPVLLKRSARYLFVQRGFTVLLTLLSIVVTLLFASTFTRYLRPLIEVAQPAGIALGSVFGTVLLWGGSQLHKRVNARIDRAFFRSAYDARLILEDLAERTRTATDREELARLLEHHLKEALQPSFLVVYLEGGDGSLTAASESVPTELRTIPVKLPILAELARRRQPWEFPPVGEANGEKSVLALLHPECLVPVMGRGGRLVGMLALGPRLSEGAYSGEDKRLLASVASQAGIALENIQLAEKMAERMETERRSAIEMQVAKEVQDKLLPQCAPVLRTLECAGRCIQTRSVGGDYYDFLDLGPGHVGLVLGDVSGKGISAALLMANLQASLRSRCVGSSGDIALQLSAVNEQLRKSSAEGYFATLFFADYDDVTRRLLFSNCGHNPPILLRADGAVERLTATATVLGLFEEWKCSTQETIMHHGDLLAIYSDGVTEAMNEVGEEFSEARFIASLREFRSFSPALLLTNVVRTVQEFAGGYQSDDLTLVIARAL